MSNKRLLWSFYRKDGEIKAIVQVRNEQMHEHSRSFVSKCEWCNLWFCYSNFDYTKINNFNLKIEQKFISVQNCIYRLQLAALWLPVNGKGKEYEEWIGCMIKGGHQHWKNAGDNVAMLRYQPDIVRLD